MARFWVFLIIGHIALLSGMEKTSRIFQEAKSGNKKTVLALLENSEISQSDANSLLYYSCLYGWDDVAEYSLQKGASPQYIFKQGCHLVLLAAQHKHRTIVTSLIKADAFQNIRKDAQEKLGLSLLSLACTFGWSDHVRTAFSFCKDSVSKSPSVVIRALHAGNGPIALWLIKQGCPIYVNEKESLNMTRNGFSAPCKQNKKGCELALLHSAPQALRQKQATYMFRDAAQQEAFDIAHMTLSYGAKINAKDAYHETALFWALQHNKENLALWLIRMGAHNLPNKSGITPLSMCISYKIEPKITMALIYAGAIYIKPGQKNDIYTQKIIKQVNSNRWDNDFRYYWCWRALKTYAIEKLNDFFKMRFSDENIRTHRAFPLVYTIVHLLDHNHLTQEEAWNVFVNEKKTKNSEAIQHALALCREQMFTQTEENIMNTIYNTATQPSLTHYSNTSEKPVVLIERTFTKKIL